MPADAAGEEDGGAGAALGQMGLWVERQGARGALRLQPERQGAAWCNQTTGELEASARSDLQARASASPTTEPKPTTSTSQKAKPPAVSAMAYILPPSEDDQPGESSISPDGSLSPKPMPNYLVTKVLVHTAPLLHRYLSC